MVLGAAAVIVVLARHTLAKSLHVLAAASPGWLLLALAAEAVSLTAFGMSRTLLLRAGGRRIGLGPVRAITYAAPALGLSVPFAGAELDVVYSYRQFRRAGLDAVAYRFISFWLVLLGAWVAFIALAHPLRRRRGP